MKTEVFTAADGKQLHVAVWECKKPVALVQIAHGMCEHIARYDRFARFLNEKGFVVFGDDHRGHGQTDPDRLGLADGDIFRQTVGDMIELTKAFKARYNLPLILFGHSYGSFLSQMYLMRAQNELAGCVLSGSALMKGAQLSFGRLIAKRRLKRKADAPGSIMASLTFHAYDRKFREGLNAWLSRDYEEVGKYNIDPQCGFTCSYGFYYWFFDGLKEIAANRTQNPDPKFKLYLTSGMRDYVGGKNASLVHKLYDNYVRLGYTPMYKLYENTRHEILNETNRDEVMADIAVFLLDCVNKNE